MQDTQGTLGEAGRSVPPGDKQPRGLIPARAARPGPQCRNPGRYPTCPVTVPAGRQLGRARAGVGGLSSVTGQPSELGDQQAAHAGLLRTALVGLALQKASGLDVRPRGGSGRDGPRAPGHAGCDLASLSCSAWRLMSLRVSGERGAPVRGGVWAWASAGRFRPAVDAGGPGGAGRGALCRAPTYSAGVRTPAPGPGRENDRPGPVPSWAGVP